MSRRLVLPCVTVALAFACGTAASDSESGDFDGGPPILREDAGIARKKDAPPSDAPDDDGAAWTPKMLPSLALWLEGSVGVTTNLSGQVQKWADQSGTGNTASLGAGNPIVSAAGINGRSGVAFTSDAFLVVAPPTNADMAADFTVLLVVTSAAQTAGFPFYTIAREIENRAHLVIEPLKLTAHITVGKAPNAVVAAVAGPTVVDGKAHVAGMRRSAAKLEVIVDGATVGVAGPPAGTVGGFQVHLGTGLEGIMAEVVFSNGQVSDAALLELTSYLKKKYAIP